MDVSGGHRDDADVSGDGRVTLVDVRMIYVGVRRTLIYIPLLV